MLLLWQYSWLQSLSVKKKQISPFAMFASVTERLLSRNTLGSHIALTLLIRLLGVDDPCLR